jgi:hypothetical protein
MSWFGAASHARSISPAWAVVAPSASTDPAARPRSFVIILREKFIRSLSTAYRVSRRRRFGTFAGGVLTVWNPRM